MFGNIPRIYAITLTFPRVGFYKHVGYAPTFTILQTTHLLSKCTCLPPAGNSRSIDAKAKLQNDIAKSLKMLLIVHLPSAHAKP